jgi:hypothetical protein
MGQQFPGMAGHQGIPAKYDKWKGQELTLIYKVLLLEATWFFGKLLSITTLHISEEYIPEQSKPEIVPNIGD